MIFREGTLSCGFVRPDGPPWAASTTAAHGTRPESQASELTSLLRRIREEYLSNTTVTIVLIGECTKARKYVDWEIASSLRNDPVNGRSGLLGINMKSVGSRGLAPPRLYDNYDSKDKAGSYALYQTYPSTAQALRNAIQMAFDRRETQKPVNTRALFKYNRPCP